MLIHNKRLHPRRPGEHGEHYSGCVLHEIEQQQHDRNVNSMSPTNGYTSSSRYNSMSSLNYRRPRTMSASPTNLFLSRTTPQPFNLRPLASSTPKRNSFGTFSNGSVFSNSSSLHDSDDSIAHVRNDTKMTNKVKSKSTICLNSHIGGHTANKLPTKPNNTVHFETYDSPDAIIANLFPDIDFKETTYLRKGYGAAEMAKRKNNNRLLTVPNYRSASALANYGSDNWKTRSYSTSSDTSSQQRIYQRQSLSAGRLASIERDFENMRYSFVAVDNFSSFFFFFFSTSLCQK